MVVAWGLALRLAAFAEPRRQGSHGRIAPTDDDENGHVTNFNDPVVRADLRVCPLSLDAHPAPPDVSGRLPRNGNKKEFF
jgi:hypothetical protein